jgi:hypothetical protein
MDGRLLQPIMAQPSGADPALPPKMAEPSGADPALPVGGRNMSEPQDAASA